jgi:Fe2+ or Zn2+ uptake regulation protein
MGIDVDGKVMNLYCDVCGEKVEISFRTFDDLINYKKRNNWKSQRRNGEWEEVCPECQEAE